MGPRHRDDGPGGTQLEEPTALHGVTLRDAFGPTISRLAARGLVAWCGDALRLTPAGLMLGNQVFAEFLPDEPTTAAPCAMEGAPTLQVA